MERASRMVAGAWLVQDIMEVAAVGMAGVGTVVAGTEEVGMVVAGTEGVNTGRAVGTVEGADTGMEAGDTATAVGTAAVITANV